MQGLKTFGIAILLLVTPTILLAQQNIDSVMVSTLRIPAKSYESGKHISIINQKQIEALPITSFDELLQYVSGVNLNSRGGFGVQSDIGMRGSTFSQVLVLVDEQRINDPLTAHFNSNLPIPLSEIHHIEIIRGSAAASYGADAVGGIIHIKTKSFQGLWEKNKTDFNGELAYGDHNLTIADAGFHSQKDHIGYSLSMRSSQSLGEEYNNPNYHSPDSLGNDKYRSHFNIKTFTSALTYRKGNFKFYGRAGVDARDFDAKYFYTASKYDESSEFVKSLWSQAALIHEGKRTTSTINIGYRNNRDSFIFNPLFTPNSHTTQRLNATLHQTINLPSVKLNYGLQLDQQKIESNDRGDHETASYAAFLLGRKKMGELNINAGLRLEYSAKIDLQFVPQFNLSYHKDKYTLRSSFGRSIRQADFTERYISHNIPALSPGRNAGNPDLKAESAYHFDLGADVHATPWLRFSQTVFYRQSTNLIDYANTFSYNISNLTNLADSASYLYAMNISESNTLGTETSIKIEFKDLKTIKTNMVLNYTYLNTQTEDSIVSKYISNHPTHQINGYLNIIKGSWLLNIGGSFTTRTADVNTIIDGDVKEQYGLIHVKLNCQVAPSTTVFVAARNLGNTSYQEILGSRMPGRWYYAGLKWAL